MSNSDSGDSKGAPRAGSQDYQVGYGKPPKHTRFKSGQSGNPKGRRKGVRKLSVLMQELLSQKVPMKERGEVKHITVLDALVRTTLKAASDGDHRARQEIYAVIRELEQKENTIPEGLDCEVSEKDKAILDDYHLRFNSNVNGDGA